MARAELAAAVSANAFGVLLFVLALASIPLGVWAGVRELPPTETLARLHAAKSGAMLALVGLVYWCARVTWIVVH
jgi:hypothetical protein